MMHMQVRKSMKNRCKVCPRRREVWGGVVWWWQADNKRGIGKIPNKLEKGIQRNKSRDSKQDTMKVSESETSGRHMRK